jgi:hypothetical protein
VNRTLRIALLITALVALLAVPTALAGKGGGKPGGGGTTSASSMTLVLMDGATEAHHYGRITFNVSTSATAVPQVGLRCYQDANWVLDAYVGYFPAYMFDKWFTLQSNYWVDGVAARCDARLFYNDSRGRQQILATMSFPVAP